MRAQHDVWGEELGRVRKLLVRLEVKASVRFSVVLDGEALLLSVEGPGQKPEVLGVPVGVTESGLRQAAQRLLLRMERARPRGV